MTQYDYDLAVIGGGSGGFGAALAAGRHGLRVLLVERAYALGGTSTLGGVNTWEPLIGGPGLHEELYRRLVSRPFAIGVSVSNHFWKTAEPWGMSRIDRTQDYRSTLRRSSLGGEQWRRVTFEPEALAAEMAAMLLETGRVDVRLGHQFVSCGIRGRNIDWLVIRGPGAEHRVRARYVLDATAQIHVCQAAGCKTYLGFEPAAMYGEPGAPAQHRDEINGATLLYRVTRATPAADEPRRAEDSAEPLRITAQICEYPCGDLNINALPLMEGMPFHRLGEDLGRRACLPLVHRHWQWLRSHNDFKDFRLAYIFPMVGVREGPRLIGRRVLTEIDCRWGLAAMRDADRCITLADHAMDTHGAGHQCPEVDQPYGVPYECLLAAEFDNLGACCRGASFSHVAASSCRPTRAIMQMGHAAGVAAAMAAAKGQPLADVDVALLRETLRGENVSLDPDDARFPKAGG